MFKVEVCKREKISIEDDASEVAYDLFCIICLLQWNFRPQCCYEEVDVSYVYNSIVKHPGQWWRQPDTNTLVRTPGPLAMS